MILQLEYPKLQLEYPNCGCSTSTAVDYPLFENHSRG